MKDIKDYLHLYLGCEVVYFHNIKSKGKRGLLVQYHIAIDQAWMKIESGYVLKEVNKEIGEPRCIVYIQRDDLSISDSSHGDSQWYPVERIKPILRPLSDMTEEEAIEIGEIVIGTYDSVKFRVERKESNTGRFQYLKVHKEHRGYGKSLTIDENGEIDVYDNHDDGSHSIYMKQHFVTKYLLSKGFDIFNLHEEKLCLYRNEKGELV